MFSYIAHSADLVVSSRAVVSLGVVDPRAHQREYQVSRYHSDRSVCPLLQA